MGSSQSVTYRFFSYTDPNGAQFSPSPANVSSIASVSEGNNTAVTGEKSDFFVSAVADEQLDPSPDCTLYLEVFSVPDTNPNLYVTRQDK